jgi:hypothetical protein
MVVGKFVRNLDPGMGQTVAERIVLRPRIRARGVAQLVASRRTIRAISIGCALAIPPRSTAPTIARLGMGGRPVLAGDASPREQYQWLMLLETHCIRGTRPDSTPLADSGNQVSYTPK